MMLGALHALEQGMVLLYILYLLLKTHLTVRVLLGTKSGILNAGAHGFRRCAGHLIPFDVEIRNPSFELTFDLLSENVI